MINKNPWLAIGATLAGLAVMLGAFGAHILETKLDSQDLEIYEIAVRYQMYHSLALILLFLISNITDQRGFDIAGYFFIVGIILFSGSLYLLVLTDTRWLGAITPIGGIAFIVGWGFLAFTGWRIR